MSRQDSTNVDDDTPTFSADVTEWHQFIKGAYSAVAGVMSGKIKYRGKVSFAFKYGSKFDILATLSREL